MLQKNILKKTPRLNQIIVRTLAGEFWVENGEFSALRCLMNILVNRKNTLLQERFRKK